MELDFALLADAAQISDGKIFILGGGITILWRGQLPAPMQCSLVAQFTYHRTEINTNHRLRIQAMDTDGTAILPDIEGEMTLGSPAPQLPPSVPLVVPLVLQFPPEPVLQRYGSHSIEILVDDRHLKSLSFVVAGIPNFPQQA